MDQDESRGPYRLQLNMVGNQWITRPEYPYGIAVHDLLAEPENSLYVSGNRIRRYPNYADYGLFYCCNDFAANAPNTDLGAATRRAQRHDFPTITDTPADRLISYMIANAGAFPRDAMDRRYVQSLQSGTLDPTPLDRPGANDALTLGFDLQAPPAAPQDSDSDGMPDAFESRYGLDPSVPDQNGTQLSVLFTGVPGHTARG